MEEKKDVSVIVATYNQNKERLYYTLDSLINQKNVDMEIIVTDDGSKDNLFSEVKEYFKIHNFSNNILLEHKENKGTVLNLYDGIKHSNGKYIKFISPGDALSDEYILCDWIKNLSNSNRKWSFSDAYYYRRNGDEICLCQERTNPPVISCYTRKNDKRCRVNYLIYDNLISGATTLCEKEIMQKYLEKILNKVIYTEDYMYRLMMFDNILPAYYPEKAIFYEYGSGISTSKNDSWNEKIHKDYLETNKIMEENDKEKLDLFQKKVIRLNRKRNDKKRVFEYYFSIYWILNYIEIKIIRRKTPKKIEKRNRNASN